MIKNEIIKLLKYETKVNAKHCSQVMYSLVRGP